MQLLLDAQPSSARRATSLCKAPRLEEIEFRVQDLLGQSKRLRISQSLFRESLSNAQENSELNRSEGINGPAALVTDNDPILKFIASTITNGSLSELESAQAIHKWVTGSITNDRAHSHMRRGFPTETLLLRCGSDRDRAILEISLCRAIGLEVALVKIKEQLTTAVSTSTGDHGIWYRGKRFEILDERLNSFTTASVEVCAPWIDAEIKIKTISGQEHNFTIPGDIVTKRRLYDGTRQIIKINLRTISAIVEGDREYLRPLAEALCLECKSKEEKAASLLNFVQTRVRYTSDQNDIDWFQFPIETIVSGKGDCEDSALLYVCLCRAVGIESVLLNPKGHLAVGVQGKFYGEAKHHDGKKYYYAETTAVGYPIGFIPEQWQVPMRVIKPN